MPKLLYFGVHGRAGPIRMLLSHAKADYENVILTHEEFGKMKADGELPSGQVPVWIDDNGVKHNQSKAILLAVGAQHGYLPTDAWELYQVMWVLETHADLLKPQHIGKLFMGNFTEEEADAFIADGDKFNAAWDARLKSFGKNFLAGDKVTVADFLIFANYRSVFLNENLKQADLVLPRLKESVAKYEDLNKWLELMSVELKDYLETEPKAFL